jgi:hypothetical protein
MRRVDQEKYQRRQDDGQDGYVYCRHYRSVVKNHDQVAPMSRAVANRKNCVSVDRNIGQSGPSRLIITPLFWCRRIVRMKLIIFIYIIFVRNGEFTSLRMICPEFPGARIPMDCPPAPKTDTIA